MTIVRVKGTDRILKVWSDNENEKTFTCLELWGEIEWDIPYDFKYEEVEVLDQSIYYTSAEI